MRLGLTQAGGDAPQGAKIARELKVRMLVLPGRSILTGITRAAVVRDRRGITAMTFAVMAFVLLGFVALSTEVAGWIFLKTTAQAAADGAAVAATLALNAGTDPLAAAQDAVSRNGFDPGTVTIASSTQPNPTANPPVLAQARAVVSVSVAPLIAGLFTGSNAIAINAGATAGMQPLNPGGTACVLSLTGDLTISAPQSEFGTCSYVSDAGDATAINVSGDQVNVYAFVTAGECANCPAPNSNYTTRPVATYQPVVGDPYAASLTSVALPTESNVTCMPDPFSGSSPYTLVPATGIPGSPTYPPLSVGHYAYCNSGGSLLSLTAPPNSTVVLWPGVYLFIDAMLAISANVTVQCSIDGSTTPSSDCIQVPTGVTLIFTGHAANFSSSALSLKIDPGATVNLGPPAASDIPSDIPIPANFGMVIWRDRALPGGTTASPAADIEASDASANSSYGLNGLLYFPYAAVTFGANSQTAGQGCTTLVAGTITLANQPSLFSDCAGYGYVTPQVLTVRITQ